MNELDGDSTALLLGRSLKLGRARADTRRVRPFFPAVVLTSLLAAAPTALAREWQSSATLGSPSLQTVEALSAPLPLGRTVSISTPGAAGERTVVARDAAFGAPFGPEQVLPGSPTYMSLATDAAGEAIAAWYDQADSSVAVSVRAAGGDTFPTAVKFTSTGNLYSDAQPRLAVSPSGAAALLFIAVDSAGRRAFVSYRPAGGSFGAPEAVAPLAADGSIQVPRDVAINDSGQVVVGYMLDDGTHQHGSATVASRDPDGTWHPAQTVGAPDDGFSPYSPRVGIDAAGRAVAVWEEGTGYGQTRRLKAAFRPDAVSVFGVARDLGVKADSTRPLQLKVSAPGEALLVTQPADPTGSGTTQPLTGWSGSTVLGQFGGPTAFATNWSPLMPQLAMNARGDAILTAIDANHVLVRRRAPFQPFTTTDETVGTVTSLLSGTLADTQLDGYGNGVVTWADTAATGPQFHVSRDTPLLDHADPVTPPDPLTIAPLVPPAPPQPPATTTTNRPTSTFNTRGTSSAPVLRLPSLPKHGMLKNITVRVRCSAACRLKAQATITRAGGGRWTLATQRGQLKTPGTLRLTFPLTAGARRGLNPAKAKRYTLTVALTARDAQSHITRPTAHRTFTRGG